MSTQTQITEAETPLKTCLPKELTSSTAFLLARVGVAIKMRVMDELGEAGCGGYGYGVLAMLGEGAQETQAAIADGLGVDRSQLVGVLDTLEQDGLVERKRDAHDRRRHAVSITAEGKRQLVRLRSTVKEIEETFLEPLDAETRKALHEALFTVASNLDPRYVRPVS
jgi:MarR family transcriptional regulator, lower aerobic nicotinate degradation pathway regulator